ncbi:MAG: hypothetical protein AAGA54_17940 [Myxococcota bacterium]
MNAPTLVQYFAPRIRSQARTLVGFGAFVALPAVGMTLLGILGEESTDVRIGSVVGGLVFTGVSIHLLRRGLAGPNRHPAIRALLDAHESVESVYPQRHKIHGVNHVASDLVVCTRTGAQLHLPCTPRREDEAMRVVQTAAPHAAMGFTEEKQAAFRRDPNALVQTRA